MIQRCAGTLVRRSGLTCALLLITLSGVPQDDPSLKRALAYVRGLGRPMFVILLLIPAAASSAPTSWGPRMPGRPVSPT